MKNQIEDFIARRFQDNDMSFIEGNCYYFAIILCDRFPKLKIYYEPIEGHFLAGDGINFYDANGKYDLRFQPKLFEEIQKEDPLWAKRIRKSCII